MEQLLSKLIDKGFIPFNIPEITEIKYISTKNKLRITSHQNNRYYKDDFYLRDLVSKESGLWQFVCENGMVDDGVEYKGYALVDVDGGAISKHETGCRYLYSNIEPEFYIMESSLCDEDELEKFILDNIKLQGTI